MLSMLGSHLQADNGKSDSKKMSHTTRGKEHTAEVCTDAVSCGYLSLLDQSACWRCLLCFCALCDDT